jgi:transporter family-2 protein
VRALLPFVAVFIAGIGLAIQPPTNASLAKVSGSVALAALISFAVGTVILSVAWLALDRGTPSGLRNAPWWAWFGGLYGAFFVAAFAFAAPRIGLSVALMLAIASQIATALVLDHFGLLGLNVSPMSFGKMAGAVLVLAGVVLVRRG